MSRTLRYFVTVEEGEGPAARRRSFTVDLAAGGGGAPEARVDGEAVAVDVVRVGDRWSVRVDGRVVDLAVRGEAADLEVFTRGHVHRVGIESEQARSIARAASRRGAAPGASGDTVVRSPMPGRVVKVLVRERDRVEAGQGLVVLEAMKMENEVRARAAGVVTKVHVAAGATVDGNAPLVALA